MRKPFARNLLVSGAIALAALATGTVAIAAGGVEHPPARKWHFQGPFGTYDRAAAQRGLHIYSQVCASCHGLKYVAFRTLAELGLSDAEVKAFAAERTIIDGPNDEGEMFDREGKPFDRFPSPFPNDQAARAANGGALPPDLSLLIKARPDGSNYMYSLLTGYVDPPAGVEPQPGQYYNAYFPGHMIKMPPPLGDDLVEHPDGTPATVDQMARDVTVFLAWAAEPSLEDRKRMGVKVILFLLVMCGLLYAAKRKVWSDVH